MGTQAPNPPLGATETSSLATMFSPATLELMQADLRQQCQQVGLPHTNRSKEELAASLLEAIRSGAPPPLSVTEPADSLANIEANADEDTMRMVLNMPISDDAPPQVDALLGTSHFKALAACFQRHTHNPGTTLERVPLHVMTDVLDQASPPPKRAADAPLSTALCTGSPTSLLSPPPVCVLHRQADLLELPTPLLFVGQLKPLGRSGMNTLTTPPISLPSKLAI